MKVPALIKRQSEKLIDLWHQHVPNPVKRFFGQLKKYWLKIWSPSIFNFAKFKQLNFLKKILSLGYTFILSLVLFIIALELNFLFLFGYMPSINEVKNPKIPLVTEVYSADDVLMGTFSIERRNPVRFDEIDSNTINALIATEDIRFYEHHGLDLYALFSAAFSTATGNKRGGSTITNQLVKNVYKTRKKTSVGILGHIPLVRTIIAKIKEWVTAIKIEFIFTKQEILTMYFNAVEYGNNSFGLKTAAEYYFRKEPNKLKLEESALLVGLLKGPSYYNPKTHPERALERRNVVLSQMNKYEFISTKTYDKVIKTKIKLNVKEIVKEKGMAPYFHAALVRELKDWCADNDYNLYTDGLKIKTTINSHMQKYAEMAVNENMRYIQQSFQYGLGTHKFWFDKQVATEKADRLKLLKSEGKKVKDSDVFPPTATEKKLATMLTQTTAYKYRIAQGDNPEAALAYVYKPHKTKLFKDGQEREISISTADSMKHMLQLLQCGLMSLSPKTGEIKAWVGGLSWDYFQYDHVDQAIRQPGSAFKPIVYARILMNGADPCSTLVDEALELTVKEDGKDVLWTPQNSDRSFTNRPMTLRKAIAYSKNSIAVKLILEAGPSAVAKLAKKMGITSEMEETLSLALGSSALSLRELTQAYAVFVNNGKFQKSRMVNSIADYYGQELVDFTKNIEQTEIMDEQTAYTMTYLLRGTVEESGGTARRVLSYGLGNGNEIGGKTGTSSNYSDGWFIGLTHDLVTGVWVGADDMRIHFENANGQGGRTALPIFGRFMQLVYADDRCGIVRGTFPVPDGYNQNISCYQYPKTDTIQKRDSIKINLDSLELDRIEKELADDLEEPAVEAE